MVDGDNRADRDAPEAFSKEWFKLVGGVVYQSLKNFFNDSGPQWAAAIAYFSVLSSFPLILAFASIGSYFVEQEWVIQQITEILGDFLPEGEEQVEQIVTQAFEARTGVSIISIGLLLWSGSRVFGVLARALNIAYDVDEMYGFFKRTLVELIMLLSIGVLIILAFASRWILSFLIENYNFLPVSEGFLYQALLQVVPAVMLLVSFFLIYLYVPRRKVRWRAALPGALLATVLFLVGRPLFIGYIQQIAEYHLIYGSLAVLIVLVVWIWLVGVFLLLGGELAAHIQDIMIEGKPVEEVEKHHLLRSPFHSKDKLEEYGKRFKELVENRQTTQEQEVVEEVPGQRDRPLRFPGAAAVVSLAAGALIFLALRRR